MFFYSSSSKNHFHWFVEKFVVPDFLILSSIPLILLDKTVVICKCLICVCARINEWMNTYYDSNLINCKPQVKQVPERQTTMNCVIRKNRNFGKNYWVFRMAKWKLRNCVIIYPYFPVCYYYGLCNIISRLSYSLLCYFKIYQEKIK